MTETPDKSRAGGGGGKASSPAKTALNWSRHGLTLLLIAACIGGYFFYQLSKHHVVHKKTFALKANDAARKLDHAAFVPVGSPGFSSALDTNFNLARSKTSATNAQHLADLEPEVQRFIDSFSRGTFDAYLDFKTAGMPYDFIFDGFTAKAVEYGITNHNGLLPTNSLALAQAIWRFATTCDTNGVGPRITAVSLDRLTVYAGKWSSKIKTPTYDAAALDTRSPQHRTPTIIALRETPAQIQKKNGTVLYAVVGIPCQINNDRNPTNAHFLHVAFYWSDRSKKWLPQEMMDDSAIKQRFKPPFNFPEAFSYPVFF